MEMDLLIFCINYKLASTPVIMYYVPPTDNHILFRIF